MYVLLAQPHLITRSDITFLLYSLWDRGQIGTKLGWKYVIYQKVTTFCRIRIFMSTGLKILFFLCKCVYYRPQHNAKGDTMERNFEGLEIQKWNKPTERAKTVNEGNGVICLVLMFTLGVKHIKMLKMVHVLYFMLITAKNHSLGKVFKFIFKIVSSSFWKCYGLLGSELPLARCNPWRYRVSVFLCWFSSLFIFIASISHRR